MTDQLNQRFQRAFIRRFDAQESRGPVIAIDVNTIEEQDMEVGIHVQCTTKTLNQCCGPGRAALERTEGKNRPRYQVTLRLASCVKMSSQLLLGYDSAPDFSILIQERPPLSEC
ncbi:MAG: hypothetical protein P8L39_11430 [Halioglobus sp.]|nr:hypothetical protein [Halioglobus sp.]